jgi:hypothetical protein
MTSSSRRVIYDVRMTWDTQKVLESDHWWPYKGLTDADKGRCLQGRLNRRKWHKRDP